MLHKIHRVSALVLVAYSVPHVINHVFAVAGIEYHFATMKTLRSIYRIPWVEVLIVMAAAAQVGTGFALVWRGRKTRRGFTARLQAYSGVCLALFLLQHVSAVFFGRYVQQLDTNFYFAAAVLQGGAHKYYFYPYYFTGVVALFIHLGVAAGYRIVNPPLRSGVMLAMAALGIVCAGVILLAFGGGLFEVRLPAQYVVR